MCFQMKRNSESPKCGGVSARKCRHVEMRAGEEWEAGGRGRELNGAEHSGPGPEKDTGFCFHCSGAFLRKTSGLLLWRKEANLDTMTG